MRCELEPRVGSTDVVAATAQEIDFDGPVDLWHFYLLRSVGKGAFGKVRYNSPDVLAFSDRVQLEYAN